MEPKSALGRLRSVDVAVACAGGGVRAAAVVAPVVAVAVLDPNGLAPFGPAKWAAVTVGVVGSAVVLLSQTVTVARSAAVWWTSFLVVAATAAVLGADPLYAWIGTPERHYGWVTWFLCAAAFIVGQQLVGGDLRRVAGALAGVGVVAGAWALAELVGWEPLALDGAGVRPTSVMGSSAFLGSLTALTTPAAMGAALVQSQSRRARGLFAVAGACSMAALVASGARAAWVGTAVTALVVIAARRPQVAPAKRMRALAAATAVLAVVVLFGAAVGVAGRVPSAVTDASGGLRGRLDEWRIAVRVVTSNPVVGVGPEGYRVAFESHVDADYERRHGRDPVPDRAHSAPLDVAATTGLPGALLLLGVVAHVGRFVRRALRGDALVAGLAAGVTAYAVQSLFLFPLAELDPLAWLVAGGVVAATLRHEARLTFDVPRPLQHTMAFVAVAVLLCGALDVAADRAARSTLDEVATGASPRSPARAATLRPDALRYRLVAARGYEASSQPGSFAAARRQLDLALVLSPLDPVARRERARLLLDRARTSLAPADVSAAVDVLTGLAGNDPNNAEVRLQLGLSLALAGDLDAAEKQWVLAERLSPASAAAPTNLAVAYARQGRTGEARRAAERALALDENRGT